MNQLTVLNESLQQFDILLPMFERYIGDFNDYVITFNVNYTYVENYYTLAIEPIANLSEADNNFITGQLYSFSSIIKNINDQLINVWGNTVYIFNYWELYGGEIPLHTQNEYQSLVLQKVREYERLKYSHYKI